MTAGHPGLQYCLSLVYLHPNNPGKREQGPYLTGGKLIQGSGSELSQGRTAPAVLASPVTVWDGTAPQLQWHGNTFL